MGETKLPTKKELARLTRLAVDRFRRRLPEDDVACAGPVPAGGVVVPVFAFRCLLEQLVVATGGGLVPSVR